MVIGPEMRHLNVGLLFRWAEPLKILTIQAKILRYLVSRSWNLICSDQRHHLCRILSLKIRPSESLTNSVPLKFHFTFTSYFFSLITFIYVSQIISFNNIDLSFLNLIMTFYNEIFWLHLNFIATTYWYLSWFYSWRFTHFRK